MAKGWTDTEIEFLQKHYNDWGASKCASHLNKSLDSIYKKANRLSVHSSHTNVSLTHEEYENKLFLAEIDFFPIERYITANTPILHECLKGHQWRVRPLNILSGKGCPSCVVGGRFDPNKSAILYYIRIAKDNEILYKIGVTNKTVKERFRLDRDKDIKIICEEYFEKGSEALLTEAYYFNKYVSKRVTRPNFLNSNGNTELFGEDVLGLDKNDS
ncbi:MAG: hypothetical protein EOP45_21840 [Sphingobacteriaceae bacterium]|nr:MAG: hypothetical protein EOP45_21840 [Sphingobacteriaceae bacterium]